MLNELYFLNIIAEALTKSDTKTTITAAFKEIEELGNTAEYALGYKQYLRFMKEIFSVLNQSQDSYINTQIKDTALQIAAGLIDQRDTDVKTVIKLIESRPDWHETFKKRSIIVAATETKPMEHKICIEKNDEPFCSFFVSPDPFIKTIQGITPGKYSIKLNTGRILMTTELKETDLIWDAAFPEKDLALAATTDDEDTIPTRRFSLLSGDLQILVFAQMENGYIKIIIG